MANMRLVLANPKSIVADKAARAAEKKALPQSFWDLVAQFAQFGLSQSATRPAKKRTRKSAGVGARLAVRAAAFALKKAGALPRKAAKRTAAKKRIS